MIRRVWIHPELLLQVGREAFHWNPAGSSSNRTDKKENPSKELALLDLGKQSWCFLQVAYGLIVYGLEKSRRESLVVQWLRICLPMKGTWVRTLVWEDPTY